MNEGKSFENRESREGVVESAKRLAKSLGLPLLAAVAIVAGSPDQAKATGAPKGSEFTQKIGSVKSSKEPAAEYLKQVARIIGEITGEEITEDKLEELKEQMTARLEKAHDEGKEIVVSLKSE